jgi:hypothetical protein
VGEARDVAAYPLISVVGTNPRFHSPEDRWPHAVDLQKTAVVCEALGVVARRLASPDS